LMIFLLWSTMHLCRSDAAAVSAHWSCLFTFLTAVGDCRHYLTLMMKIVGLVCQQSWSVRKKHMSA
jgi:hypothetical protein